VLEALFSLLADVTQKMEEQKETKNETAAASKPSTGCGNWDRNDPDQQELSKIYKSWNIPKDPTSIIMLAEDGVLRNLSGDRKVHDAVGLSPRLIKAFLNRMRRDQRPDRSHVFEGVDGTKTPKEKWYKPDNPETLFPPPLSKEMTEKAWKWYAEHQSKQELENKTLNEPVEAS
jgi:hypothetical protein